MSPQIPVKWKQLKMVVALKQQDLKKILLIHFGSD